MTAVAGSGLTPRVSSATLDSLADEVSASREGANIAVLAPFTESEIGTVPASTPDDVAAAVARARRAQETWAATPVRERARVLSRFHDLLIDHADVAMDIIQLEAGKARIPAFEEVYDTVATTHYYLKTGPGLLARKRRAVSFPVLTTAYEYRHPVGVVGAITPWNFPFTLSISDVLPALLAGNTVLVKPDEKTPFSVLYGKRLLTEAGAPEDVFQVVTGHGEELGPALVDEVDFVMFTGSTSVGRSVSEQAGRRLIGSSMELGGKNAAIVMSDARLDQAIPGISRAIFATGGQLCIAMERVYVDEAIRDQFVDRLVAHTRELEMTTRFDFSSALSSMISRPHLEKVQAHVDDAVAKGAALLVGGKPRPDVGPLFYEPTLLTDVDETMEVCRGETFGPVASIYGYHDIDEAIAAANDSEFGLNFSVWSGDTRAAVAVASRLQAGTVGVNDGYAAAWSSFDAPMGGMKASGLGRRHAAQGILKYTESQTVAVQRIAPAFAPFAGLAYEKYHKLLGRVLKFLKWIPFYK
jgi:succinate-semialdehyde dehydrogenase/glutarate-semialdehyde dehydrogenase